MVLIVNAAPPLFVSVTDCAALVVPTVWLAKVKLVGENVTAAADAAFPVPESETICGLPAAESVTVNAPVRVPVCVGVKVTAMLQLAPAARLAGQELVCAKSPLVPILLTLSAAPPLFVSVTDCAALVVPTVWPANVRLPGVSDTAGEALFVTVMVEPAL